MDKKITSIVAYAGMFLNFIPFGGILGWAIAYFVGDRKGAKFHLNQALILLIAGVIISVIGFIPIIKILKWPLTVILFLFAIVGLINAIREEEKPLPFIGGFKIL